MADEAKSSESVVAELLRLMEDEASEQKIDVYSQKLSTMCELLRMANELRSELFRDVSASDLRPDAAKTVYTVDDLAKRYGLSKQAIRQRIKAKEFGEDVVRTGTHRYCVPAEGVRMYDDTHLDRPYHPRTGKRPAAAKRRGDPGPI